MSLIGWAFKRGFSTEQTVQSKSPGQTITTGHLFGRPLSDVIKDNTLPSPIVVCTEGNYKDNPYGITFQTSWQ